MVTERTKEDIEKSIKRIMEFQAKRDINEINIIGENHIIGYKKEGFAEINFDLMIDVDLKLFESIKDLYFDDGLYSRVWHNSKYQTFQRYIYSFFTGEQIEKGYEIDHLNSNIKDNRISNLMKLNADTHKRKLKSINDFKMHDITFNISRNIFNNDILIMLSDFSINRDKNGDNIRISIDYDNHLMLYLLYSKPETMIDDIEIFNSRNIKYKDVDSIIRNKTKLRDFVNETKADKILKVKLI